MFHSQSVIASPSVIYNSIVDITLKNYLSFWFSSILLCSKLNFFMEGKCFWLLCCFIKFGCDQLKSLVKNFNLAKMFCICFAKAYVLYIFVCLGISKNFPLSIFSFFSFSFISPLCFLIFSPDLGFLLFLTLAQYWLSYTVA